MGGTIILLSYCITFNSNGLRKGQGRAATTGSNSSPSGSLAWKTRAESPKRDMCLENKGNSLVKKAPASADVGLTMTMWKPCPVNRTNSGTGGRRHKGQQEAPPTTRLCCCLYAKQKDIHWKQWIHYCMSKCSSSRLLPAQSPSYKSLPSGSSKIAYTVCFVGQKLTSLWTKDPRTDHTGTIDYRLSTQVWGYKKAAPSWVKLVPIALVMHALQFAYHVVAPNLARQAAANMIYHFEFFFCLKPAEDASFYLGSPQLHTVTSPAHKLVTATLVTLTFTTQENGDKGEASVTAHA
eukprot:jgi/Psemu1/7910/gm1.7910_g